MSSLHQPTNAADVVETSSLDGFEAFGLKMVNGKKVLRKLTPAAYQGFLDQADRVLEVKDDLIYVASCADDLTPLAVLVPPLADLQAVAAGLDAVLAVADNLPDVAAVTEKAAEVVVLREETEGFRDDSEGFADASELAATRAETAAQDAEGVGIVVENLPAILDASNQANVAIAGAALSGLKAASSATSSVAAVSAAGIVGNYDTLALANAALASIPTNGGVSILADGANNGFYVKQGGVLIKKSASTLAGLSAVVPYNARRVSTDGAAVAARDTKGGIAFGVDGGGDFMNRAALAHAVLEGAGIDSTRLIINATPKHNKTITKADLDLWIVYGQSNGLGTNNEAITTSQDFGDLRLVSASATSFVPLVESSSESCATSFAAQFQSQMRQALPVWSNYEQTLVVANASRGGELIAALAAGTSIFAGMMAMVTRAVQNAAAINKTIAVRGLIFIHGESDTSGGTSKDAYKTGAGTTHTGLLGLYNSFVAGAKAATAQSDDVPMFLLQQSNGGSTGNTVVRGPAQAMGELASEYPDKIFTVCAPWLLQEVSDNLHWSSYSQRKLGAYLGNAAFRYYIDRRLPRGTKPISFEVLRDASGVRRFIDVEMDAFALPLRFDTDNIPAAANFGFSLTDGAGTTIPIAGVSLISPSKVRIVASAAVPTGAILANAVLGHSTVGYGRLQARSNLVDSERTLPYYPDFDGKRRPLFNPCCLFTKVL